MDKLTQKQYGKFDYICRFSGIPYYYDTVNKREIFGVGTAMNRETEWVTHKVNLEDTLDALALTYYNNPTLYWVIAAFNKILDPFMKLSDKYTMLKIPAISSIEFKADRP